MIKWQLKHPNIHSVGYLEGFCYAVSSACREGQMCRWVFAARILLTDSQSWCHYPYVLFSAQDVWLERFCPNLRGALTLYSASCFIPLNQMAGFCQIWNVGTSVLRLHTLMTNYCLSIQRLFHFWILWGVLFNFNLKNPEFSELFHYL